MQQFEPGIYHIEFWVTNIQWIFMIRTVLS